MRKSTRSVLIIAVALIIIGGLFTAAGAALGGGFRYWPGSALNLTRFHNWGLFSRLMNLSSESAELEPFTSVRMDTHFGAVSIRYGGGYAVDFINCPLDTLSWSVDNGELAILDTARHGDDYGQQVDESRIDITLPEGAVLTGLNVEHALGAVTCSVPVRGESVIMDLDLGNLTLSDVEARRVKLTLDLGDLTASDVSAERFEADLDLGGADLRRINARDVVIDCNMGDLELELVGRPEDYGYDIRVDMGSLRWNGRSLGFADRYFEQGDARPCHLRADLDLGSADIRFTPAGEDDAPVPPADPADGNGESEAPSESAPSEEPASAPVPSSAA